MRKEQTSRSYKPFPQFFEIVSKLIFFVAFFFPTFSKDSALQKYAKL
jgi:hypothetical protein